MEEKKKKRVEQKILQSDEKVRRLSGLWASPRAVRPGGVSRALARSVHARIPSDKGRLLFSIPLHIPVGTGPVHAALRSGNVAAPACPGQSPAGDSLTWPTCSDWSMTQLGVHLGQVWVSEPDLAPFLGGRLGWWPRAGAAAVLWL